MSVEELAEALSRFVNSMDSRKIEQLAKAMAQDHPTLQQSKMRLACLFIEEMASKKHFDVRNESSVITAKSMIQGYKDMSKQRIIDQDGVISNSLEKFIDEGAKPSGELGII